MLFRSGRTDVAGFTLGGLSKSIGLPQAKLGWIAVSGPASFVGETMPRLELVCDTYLSVSTPVQLATPALLEHGAAVREAIQSRLRENLAACDAMLAAAPSCTRLHAAGGWYAVLRVPSLQPEDELMLSLLEHDRVLVQPGYFFDFAHESFLVVSLLPEPAAFREGLSRVLARFSHVGRA